VNEGHVYRSTVPGEAHQERLADYLTQRYPHSSRAAWVRRIEDGLVEVDSLPAKPDQPLQAGSELCWHRPPWTEPDAPNCFAILYEDADLLGVAKPAGLPTLPGAGYLSNTLLHRVRDRFPGASPLHRLGRWTSGLVLFARTSSAMQTVSEAWKSRRVHKVYRALAEGNPREDRITIETPIGPVPHSRLGTVHAASAEGRPSRSVVQVLERRAGRFLAEVAIGTGRPHQIRIHLASAGYPLAGDPLYLAGGIPAPDTKALPGDPGYLLHAMELGLAHPVNGRGLTLFCRPPAALRTRDSVR
jgi:23S rRNA pseudouridine1911/1915/1917 synthase